jgi:hypothetical protein
MAIELTTATSAELSGIRQSLYAQTDITRIFPNGRWVLQFGQITIFNSLYGSIADFKNCQFLTNINAEGFNQLEQIFNAQDLTNVENLGTVVAVNIESNNLSESALNQFFTDLPATSKTATINVVNNPGTATCDPTIATNKGYTVVTS